MKNFEHYLSTIGEYGVVEEIHHPIVIINGLPEVSLNELVMFDNGNLGQVVSFSQNKVQALLLSPQPVNIKSQAVRTNKIISISVGRHLLGQVIDPQGNIIGQAAGNAKTSPGQTEELSVERAIPVISQRTQITRQVITGFPVIDLLLPISHGQRAVLIGDQQTGKTSFLLSAAEAIAASGTLVIYAAIGKHWNDLSDITSSLQNALAQQGAIIVASSSHDAPGLINLTPFTAMTLAEFFRDQGQDVFLILDDLSTHAKVYREISLLGRRFPGRESYPGDMFHVHARLLERAGCFIHPEKGQATITCLAVADTIRTLFTPIIVSNLISITDGHLLFDASIANHGRFPAIDFTLSITRVGKKTQAKAVRQLTNKISVLLSSYLKTERYSHLGAELSPEVRDLLLVGEQYIQFISQEAANHIPMPVQITFAGIIWQRWVNEQSTTLIPQWRDNLAAHYLNNPHVRSLLDDIVSAPDLDTLLKKLDSSREELRTLCRTNP